MIKLPALVILAVSFGVVFGASGFDTAITRESPLLRDGFVLRGVDGELSGPDNSGAWFFEIAEDVNDYRAIVKAGTKLELLPSSALEMIIADSKARSEVAYRLWNGRVTKYKGSNFIFPTYFLPLSPIKKPKARVPERPGTQKKTAPVRKAPVPKRPLEPVVRDPDDVLDIPVDVLEKLRDRRRQMAASRRAIVDSNSVSAVDPNQAGQDKRQPEPYSKGADSVFVDRTAYLVDRDDGGLAFTLDALGRNVQQLSLRLLPCEVLELAELKRTDELESVRFKIAGILTKYQDQEYLLLQKATQTYSHGNFGR